MKTRTKDITVSLKERSANFEKKGRYDYFISFHRNVKLLNQRKQRGGNLYLFKSSKGKG